MCISKQYSSIICLSLKQDKFYLKGKNQICEGIIILKEPPVSEVNIQWKQMFFSVLLTLLGIKTFVLFVLQHFIELQSPVHFKFMLNEA